MRKKGFTLIELLAVIAILAIIALIATPMIMDVIENSRKGAAIESVNGILESAESYRAEKLIDQEEYEREINLTGDILKYKGSKPESGTLIINEEGKMYIIAKYGNYCIEKKYTDIKPQVVDREDCGAMPEPLDYVEPLLHGADPVLTSAISRTSDSFGQGLIPVTIDSNGTVKRADLKKEWYKYEEKRWANAVILTGDAKEYQVEEVINPDDIESYFVWIPKYSYQLWDMGNYSGLTGADSSKVHPISIQFGLENTSDEIEGQCTTPMSEDGTQGLSGESGNCQVGDYMTHPAFLAFNANGFWVGKFETSQNTASETQVIIKPNTYSWKNINVGNAFRTSYEYKRNLDSHMMKNTEWGAVAYLSHSNYGINKEITINNNSYTGYAMGNNTYNTEAGYTASTTGNITGIYDMSGGTIEYVMGYVTSSSSGGDQSEITSTYLDFFTDNKWKKYYDKYDSINNIDYYKRILGDSTGEVGPFYVSNNVNSSSWYSDCGDFSLPSRPWFNRGGRYDQDAWSGIFYFHNYMGVATTDLTFRIILTPKN